MKTVEIKAPLDMHLHFREGDMLELVAPLSAETFAGGLIMPNLVPPVKNLPRLLEYRQAIEAAIAPHEFTPYMALFFRDYTEAELTELKPHILGVKLYPEGATTNSEGGVSSIEAIEPTLALMSEMGIPLMVHGEQADEFVMDREAKFMPIYENIAKKFPRLKITMEHITTCEALTLLDRYENLYATVTLQHLMITLDDVAGGMLNPHLFCKPIAKRPEDRDALQAAALSAHPKLMFGSDSAPHPRSKKECCGCAAGVFSAPIALAVLAELFDTHGALHNLQSFVSDTAQSVYGVKPSPKTIVLEEVEQVVPALYGDVVPYLAGQRVAWRVRP